MWFVVLYVNFFRFTDGKLIISNTCTNTHAYNSRYQILPFISKLRRKLRAHQKNARRQKDGTKIVHLMSLPTIQLVEFTVDKRNYKQRQNTFFLTIIDWLKISFKKIIIFFSQIKMRPSRPFDCSFLSDEIFNELLAYIFRLVLSLTNTRKKSLVCCVYSRLAADSFSTTVKKGTAAASSPHCGGGRQCSQMQRLILKNIYLTFYYFEID